MTDTPDGTPVWGPSPRSLPPLRRLLLESLAVILSILLDFAIDAWWEGH